MFTSRSKSLCDPYLLAQEGTPLTSGINHDDSQQCSYLGEEKHFHARRIAQSERFPLCREFANAKQL